MRLIPFYCALLILTPGTAAASRDMQTLTGKHLKVSFFSEPNTAHRILFEAEDAISSVSDHLSLQAPIQPLHVLLFPSLRKMRSYLSAHCPAQKSSAAACFEKGNGFEITLALKGNKDEILKHLRHEVTHYVLASNFYDMPPWIDEGLAEYFEPGKPFGLSNRKHCRNLRQVAGKKKKSVLERLVIIPAGTALDGKQYALSWGLVIFLMEDERFGLDCILCYLRNVRSGQEARQHFSECFGMKPSDLEESWRQNLLTDYCKKKGVRYE